MGLNIKNERVHDLARQAAEVTGKSQTGAIEEALTRLLADHGVDAAQRRIAAKVDVIRGIALAYEAAAGDPGREIRRVEDLYDDATGLPR